MAKVEVKPTGGVCLGALGGLALLLFAGALVVTSQIPGVGLEAVSGLRGRRLQPTVVTVPDTTAATVAVGTPVAATNAAGAAATPGVTYKFNVNTAVKTTIIAAAPAGAIVIDVADVTPFAVGMWIVVGAGTTASELRHIKTMDATTHTITFYKVLVNDHAAGENVYLQPESSADQSEHQISSGSSQSLESLAPSKSSLSSLESLKSSESGSSEGNLPKTMGYAQGGGFFGGWFFNFALALCYACAYKSKVVEPMGVMRHQPLQHEMHNDFRYGLCDCFKDINICLMTMCCPFVRMAHTNEAADVCGFWESLVCMWCSTLCLCGPLCLQVYFRIHIKDHMGIQDHCFNDFCVAFFCLPCVTGQQALAVDEVLGWKFKCPCNIEHVSMSSGTQGYGQAGNWS